MVPVGRRTIGDDDKLTLAMRAIYAQTLYKGDGATLDDLREAVTMLEEIELTTRRVLGGAHPTVGAIAYYQRDARAALHARETPSTSA